MSITKRPAQSEAPESFVITRDFTSLTPEEYAELVVALGDIVRAAGGLGVELWRGECETVTSDARVPS